MVRSVIAIVAGIAVIAILAFSADGIARRIKVDATSLAFLWTSIAYTAVFSAAGGVVTARIARRTGFRDALILAAIQFLASIVAAVLMFEPSLLWYYAVIFVFSAAAIVAGGYAASRVS